MNNLVDYIKNYKNKSLSEEPFNELDAAIFSRLSYIDYASLIKSRKYFSLKPISSVYKKLNKINDGNRYKFKEDKLLLEEVSTSIRFKELYVKSFIKLTDKESTKQFSAVTFFNKSKTNKFLLISFRGTDGTYTGRKEDFELCYKNIIPAQVESEKYLKKIIRFTKTKTIYVVGHSKGGNLAIYASANSKNKRIKEIYAFDSPGFNKLFVASKNFQSIKQKIKHFAPQTSIIGRLLYKDYETTVVDSDKALLNQHNIFNWNVESNHFKTLNKFTFISNKISDSIKTNLEKMSYEERVEFVESLFSVIKDLTEDDTINFGDSIFTFILRFRKVLKTKSEETKRVIYSIFGKDNPSKEEPIKVIPIKNKDKE